MRTLALLAFLGCAALAQAQQPKTYAPEKAPGPNEETVLNARVVSVDVAGARVTVRGVDVKADGGRDETYSVAAPAASRLGEFKRGMEVMLRLRGATVVDVKASPASGAQGNATAGGATRGQTRNGARAGTTTNGAGRSATGAGTPVNGTVVPAVGTTVPVGGTAPVIPEGVVPMPATAEPAVPAPSAPNAGPTPSMIGVAPGTGNARTNAQGAITLTGSPAAPSPAARTTSPAARAGTKAGARPAAPRAAATPQPTVTPQPGVAPQPEPQTSVVSPQPVPGGRTPGPITPGVVTPGGVITSTPSPAAYGTPFPTPRPQPTPIPVGAPPAVGTPAPVLVPSDAPPSPATTPTPPPQTR